MKQYYHIEIRTVPYWHDDLKIAVNNLKELKQYVKSHIEDCLREYSPTKEFKKENNIKRIYKRLNTTNMFVDDKKGISHKIGKVFTIGYLNNDHDIEDYVSYWCHKLTQKDILDHSKEQFKELGDQD